MVTPTEATPVILIGGLAQPSLASLLQADGYGVVEVPTGAAALEWVRESQPDIIVAHADLPDMAGLEVCESLRRDARIGHNVPILILAPEKPTPQQRVMALGAGAWDFLRFPGDFNEIRLKLQSYLQAKRNLDLARAEGPVDPVTGLHSRVGLARRAREFGALMSRKHGSLACVVFALEADVGDRELGELVARTTRVSDVVGTLSSTQYVVLAPETDDAGAVRIAQRVAGTLRQQSGRRTPFAPGYTLRAGYDAVSNFSYSPIDPVTLLTRAAAAVLDGKPESGSSWVRRFQVSVEPEKGTESSGPTTPPAPTPYRKRSE
jgi:CheY-like chemotaxis protein